MIRIVCTVAAVFALAAFATVALAGETNFTPANTSGGASAAEAKKIQAAPAASQSGEGFWAKEWKRSGFSETSVKLDRFPNVLGGVADFFKKKDEEYRARNPKTT